MLCSLYLPPVVRQRLRIWQLRCIAAVITWSISPVMPNHYDEQFRRLTYSCHIQHSDVIEQTPASYNAMNASNQRM
jgi:hypothetical protein